MANGTSYLRIVVIAPIFGYILYFRCNFMPVVLHKIMLDPRWD